jgi:hypothetical protein
MSRSTIIAIVGIALAATVAIAWALDTGDESSPTLIVGDSVASDFEALARQTFDEFVVATPAIADCFGAPRLEAAPGLDELATYDRHSVTIAVRVPATAPSLTESLVHEFAHHAEAACSSHQELRGDFLTAQGHEPGTAWFGDDRWEDRPSEQYAEAVVQVVLGERRRNQLLIRLTPEAVALIADWLGAATD